MFGAKVPAHLVIIIVIVIIITNISSSSRSSSSSSSSSSSANLFHVYSKIVILYNKKLHQDSKVALCLVANLSQQKEEILKL